MTVRSAGRALCLAAALLAVVCIGPLPQVGMVAIYCALAGAAAWYYGFAMQR